MVAAKAKKGTIEAQLIEFEKRLRLQMMKEKLAALDGDARVKDSLDNGHMPTIHERVSRD
jgi:hypothetical protein